MGHMPDLGAYCEWLMGAAAGTIRLAIYNAGTDILRGDRIGRLDVSADGIRERDRYVVDALKERKIPTVIVTSGGYTRGSYELVADLALHAIDAGR